MLKLKTVIREKIQILKVKNEYVLITELPNLNDLEVTTGDVGIVIHYELSGQSPEVQRIEWNKDGQILDTNTYKYVGGSIYDSSFTIRLPTEEDKGKYSCIITNAVGSVSKDVMLGNFHVFYGLNQLYVPIYTVSLCMLKFPLLPCNVYLTLSTLIMCYLQLLKK